MLRFFIVCAAALLAASCGGDSEVITGEIRVAPELVHDLDVGAGDKDVYPRVSSIFDCGPGLLYVVRDAACERGDDRPPDLRAYGLDCLEVAGGACREAGLYDVDAEPVELLGDLQLLLGSQPDAGRLLAVSQGSVEYDYFVVGHCFAS